LLSLKNNRKNERGTNGNAKNAAADAANAD
jgi:hypothetical protein